MTKKGYVKLRFLKDLNQGEFTIKKGEVIDTKIEGHKPLVNDGIAEYVETISEPHEKKTLEIAPDRKTAMKLNKTIPATKQQEKTVPRTRTIKTYKNNNMNREEETKEPVIYNGEPHWLIIKEREVTQDSGRDIRDTLTDPLSPKTEPVFYTKKQGLWQCKRCDCIIESNPSEPAECYEEQGGCGRTSTFKQVTENINRDLWKIPVWKDIDIDMMEVYDDMIKLMKRCVVFPEEIHYKIFTLWIISTWKTGHWSSVGFPVLLGDHDSGKTRVLDIIRELGYRMIHAAGTTFPAMVRATHFHHAGLIIDEASDRLNPKTESGREMLNFIKPSYRIGSRYTSADKEDPKKINSYNNFGFKVFAGERNFTAAVISRSINVLMQQAEPEIPELYYIQDKLDEIQTKLLNYRYKTGNPTDLGIDFVLKGRLREVFGCVISTAMFIGQTYDDIIDYALNIKKEQQSDLIGTLEHDILQLIKDTEETQTTIDGGIMNDSPEHIFYKDILEKLYPDIETTEEKRTRGQQMGYAVRRLRLRVKKLHGRNVIPLHDKRNASRLKYLYRRYGMK